jgi:hypothetical protein
MPPKKLLSLQNPKSLIGLWLFAIVWCAIAFPLFYVFGLKERSVMGGAIGGLFALIGVAMLYSAAKGTLEYLKYGEVHLTLEGEPPAVGRSFSARLVLPPEAAGAATIRAELACVRVTWSRGTKGGPTKGEQEAWTVSRDFPVRRSTAGGYLTLRLDIPADKPPSDLPEESAPDAMVEGAFPGGGVEVGRSYYRWELRIKADVPGIDLERTFRLRVLPPPAGTAPTAVPRVDPILADPGLHARLLARRAAERRLATASACVAFVPFLAPFALAGIAAGLAGCPLSWRTGQPPSCAFAGIDWGPLMARAFELMFVAGPAGIATAVLLQVAGSYWIARRHERGPVGLGRYAGAAVALAILGGFFYQGGFLDPLLRSRGKEPARGAASAPAARTVSRVGHVVGFDIQPASDTQYVIVAGRGVAAEASGAHLRVRIGEVFLEKHPERDGVDYRSLGIDLYDAEQRMRQLGSSVTSAVRGTLTAGNPVATYRDQDFTIPNAANACSWGRCAVRLRLTAQASHDVTHVERTNTAPVRMASIGESAASRAAPPARWEGYFNRALDAFSDGRYGDAYAYYERAHAAARDLDTTEYSRNRKLAGSAAGLMATACMLGRWDVADRAMAELKERIGKVEPAEQKRLEYWIRTGEPRLKARKC